jgi:hypothetical protein
MHNIVHHDKTNPNLAQPKKRGQWSEAEESQRCTHTINAESQASMPLDMEPQVPISNNERSQTKNTPMSGHGKKNQKNQKNSECFPKSKCRSPTIGPAHIVQRHTHTEGS